jgi:hypothetical protein
MKYYFSVIPTNIWEEFRKLPSFDYNPHIKSAHAYIKGYNKEIPSRTFDITYAFPMYLFDTLLI